MDSKLCYSSDLTLACSDPETWNRVTYIEVKDKFEEYKGACVNPPYGYVDDKYSVDDKWTRYYPQMMIPFVLGPDLIIDGKEPSNEDSVESLITDGDESDDLPELEPLDS